MNFSLDRKPSDPWGFELLLRFIWEVVTDGEFVFAICRFIGHVIFVIARFLFTGLFP